ncbi:sigma-70 family RNA polymerase sigma factor [Streptomyces brasiliscabiei]|uniref:sigma-70 family RNA polymerase sigma factor n=1 Tax=Streptomyces brasiliscabiei TaxID=2736302 RepID=UPI001C127924|nr:sigma-70 family RNA polymerase sigma factor [Streptomyces brasiliscabiei]
MDTHLARAGHDRTRAVTTAEVTTKATIGEPDPAVSVFVLARPGLLRIARRILGDANDAEDVIQEAWLRWQGTDRALVVNPTALLRTTTVRLAINVVQSARRRRESCASPWLPEFTDGHATPEALAERRDAAERAVLLLMETLTPRQRAVYVLREGFGCSYGRIAELLCLTVANTRQQVVRAQRRLAAGGRGQPVDSVAHRRLVEAFLTAAHSGDLDRLERVLCADAGCTPARSA